MDFRQTTQPISNRPAAAPAPAPLPPEHKEDKHKDKGEKTQNRNWLQLFNGVMLISIALLVAGVAIALTRTTNNTQSKYVDTSKYQAVFLNSGQVYFGNIETLNSQYLRMTNVYYLTQTGASTSSNYSLVKLGCQQIHDPLDEMVINQSQVTFWENLADKGKVVSSINDFKKQNPNGPDCSQVSNQTQATSTDTQGATSTTGSGTNSTTTTK